MDKFTILTLLAISTLGSCQEHIGSGFTCQSSSDCRVESKQICRDSSCQCLPLDIVSNDIPLTISWDSHFQQCILEEGSLCYKSKPDFIPRCAQGTACRSHPSLTAPDEGTCQLQGDGEPCTWAEHEVQCRKAETGQLCHDGRCQCARFAQSTKGIEMDVEFANDKCGLAQGSLCFMAPSRSMLKCGGQMQCRENEEIPSEIFGQGTCQ